MRKTNLDSIDSPEHRRSRYETISKQARGMSVINPRRLEAQKVLTEWFLVAVDAPFKMPRRNNALENLSGKIPESVEEVRTSESSNMLHLRHRTMSTINWNKNTMNI